MKKILKYSIGLAISGLMFTACSDYLDINQDSTYPTVASTANLLSSGTTWSAAILGSDVQLVSALWSQQYAQNTSSQQYTTIDNYNLANNSTYFSRYWQSIYSGALPDLKQAMSQAEKNNAWNYWLPAKVLTAYNYNMLVSLFEKIPFSQALQGNDNLIPVYDDSKAVDAGILKLLDDAIAKKAAAVTANGPTAIGPVGAADMVFQGDYDKWMKFAKTLKLKIYMRDFSTNQTAIQTLLTEGDLLGLDSKGNPVEAKLAQFVDAENKSNPLYESDRRKLNTTTNIRVSATLVAFLKANADPRIAVFAEPTTQMIQIGATAAADKIVDVPANLMPYYRGCDQGCYGSTALSGSAFPPSVHSRAVLAPSDPVYFISAVESFFLQAEAWARIGDATKAKAAYDTAVKLAFSRWGFDGSSFVAAGGKYEFQSGSTDAMLKSILTQKWVSSTRTDAWNAFFDICRTGIPAMGTQTVTDLNRISQNNANYVVGTLAPSIQSVLLTGQYPHRFLFPKISADNNPNAPTVIPINQKMWWHK
jgi:hypothetical protein